MFINISIAYRKYWWLESAGLEPATIRL